MGPNNTEQVEISTSPAKQVSEVQAKHAMWRSLEGLDLNDGFNTSLRRVWISDRLYWDWPKIEDTSWARDEKCFWNPMTKPALSADQYMMLMAEYADYLTEVVVLNTPLSKTERRKIERIVIAEMCNAMASVGEGFYLTSRFGLTHRAAA